MSPSSLFWLWISSLINIICWIHYLSYCGLFFGEWYTQLFLGLFLDLLSGIIHGGHGEPYGLQGIGPRPMDARWPPYPLYYLSGTSMHILDMDLPSNIWVILILDSPLCPAYTIISSWTIIFPFLHLKSI